MPKTGSGALVGTPFDHLMGANLKRLMKSYTEESLIAEMPIGLAARFWINPGAFRCKDRAICRDELGAMIEVAKKFREEKAES